MPDYIHAVTQNTTPKMGFRFNTVLDWSIRNLTRTIGLICFCYILTSLIVDLAIQITFKDEGAIDGEPIGPVAVLFSDGRTASVGWQTLAAAESLAKDFVLPLELG
jgi:hypothetical protein